MPRTRFGWEKLETLLAEPNSAGMIADWWEEMHPDKAAAPLDPAWDDMLAMEKVGRFKCWTVREDKTLAGFVCFHVFPHLHHRSTLFAIDGGYYLSPEFRDYSRLGYRMFKTVRTALKAEGVRIIVWHDNLKRPLMPFFLALGATPRSIMYWDVI